LPGAFAWGSIDAMSEVVPKAPLPERRARVVRWVLRVVAGLLLLWIVAWLAVPPIVKSQAEQRLSTLLGREVRIGRIGFSPWSLILTVEKLTVAAAAGAGAAPQLSVERIMANADMRSVLRLAPVIEALQIDAPVLRVAHVAEGRYDFDDIVQRLADNRAPPTPDKPDEPARFALYNLKLQGGSVEFDDRPVQRVHQLQDLQVAVPFLSNLPDLVTVDVLPRLAFKLNGAAFDSGAQTKPFAQDRASQIDLRITDLDLAPWLPYVPAGLPLKPLRGTLATQLQVQFALAADGTPRVSVRGSASLADAAFASAAGAAGAPAVAWRHLDVTMTDVQPLARKVALGDVTLGGAQIDARRDAQGRINLMPATSPAPTPAPSAAAASATASPASAPAAPAARSPWQVSVARLALNQARIDWHDDSTRPAAALRAEPVDLQVSALRWPFEAPAPIKLGVRLASLGAPGTATGEPATLSLEGQATDRVADVHAELQGLELAWLEPYLATALTARLEGRASARAALSWIAGDSAQIKLSGANVTVDAARLVDANGKARAPVSVAGIALGDAAVDLAAQQVTLGTLKIDRPALALTRDTQGRWNFAQWARSDDGAPGTAAESQDKSAAPWSVKLGELQLNGGEFRLDDQRPAATPSQPVRVRGALSASVRELAWPSGPAAKTQLQLRISQIEGAAGGAAARSSGGRIDWNGRIDPAPRAARGTLRIERFPVHAFEPYLAAAHAGLNVALLRGEVDWRGDVDVAQRANDQWDASAKGNARINELRLHERTLEGAPRGGDELLTWQAFTLDGIVFDMRGGARPRVEIASVGLTDFYSRLVITEDGHFNQRDVAVAPKPEGAASAPAPAATPSSAPASAPVSASATPGNALPIDIRIGGVKLANGKVDFTDRFIKPNYSAALTELNGTLGAFDSTTRAMATLELKGRAAGTALLEIGGSLNPTARPLALDIRAKATDLELAPLSPYAGRYAGYAIERGKLSMDVAYKIDADGKLEAKNQVILNQLTFGDKVESPDATKLPVLLAVALLKDRNGVIDINLPVSGSINDPQFSVFGIVLKIIGNLLVKALTAPFALLAGSGEDLSYVGFVPGTTVFNEAGKATIDKVAKALTDRPTLKMTVTGASDPQSEREAIQQAALAARIAAEQRRDALRAGAAVDAPLPALATAQREALVRRIYSDARLPNKPRNALGIARDIPLPEMEALLRGATLVTSDSARELALQRGLAVRDALVAKGLPGERLFLAAPKLRASGEEDAAWSPRVQLALSTQ
jgi:uncharacterized protein involved in outer membrane biogenesis